MRYWVGTAAVLVTLVAVGGAGSASTNVNPNGIAIFPVEGVRFSGLVATFTDPTAPAHSSYSVTIEWGDGESSSGSLVSTGGKENANDVNGQHTYAQEGVYTLRITVTGGSGKGISTPTATVSDAPLTANVLTPAVVEGGSLSGPIATFTDANTAEVATAFTATIDWGDGTNSPGTVTRTGAGTFSVGANHTFGEEGQFTVRVTVKDAGGATASPKQAITVGDAPLAAGAPFTLHGTERRARVSAVATFHDGFASSPVTDFTAAINWGDGKSGPGTVAAAPGGGWQVSGSHAYAEEGRYKTSVTVNDKGGATTTIPGAAVIADAPLRAFGLHFAIHVGRAFHGRVATFTDAAGAAPLSDYTARINWGDGSSSAGRVSRRAGRLSVTGTHTYRRAGAKPVTVQIHDRGGGHATARSHARALA